ncbi:DUF3889 domain-containing protein [Thalassobacillus pellis]|uniref:DUF3889 domain-containing protein n=1 Tax=Thalassobacillus pellis TaxID=748008 RepID=UPI001961A6B2|nr:DUF3889 domain-containing protein [Thalassobacillus pellis]MBM7552577.1 rare lipoprotein A [Thalassobacillus pellis]
MFPYYCYGGSPYHRICANPYRAYPQFHYYPIYRQQTVAGQASWTEGGSVTQCGIPWSQNANMTVAVGQNSPYQCGQTLKVRNPANGREVIVTVVDQVPNYPRNKLNLHREAFQALGANLDAGIINVEITPSPELEEEKWGKYLLEITQAAYPNYGITNYETVSKTQVSANEMRETYEYVLQSQQETINVQGVVTYNPTNDRILSIDIREV